MSFRVLGRVIVILSSTKATHDLLKKRGQIYSDRPVFPFFEMLIPNGSLLSLLLLIHLRLSGWTCTTSYRSRVMDPVSASRARSPIGAFGRRRWRSIARCKRRTRASWSPACWKTRRGGWPTSNCQSASSSFCVPRKKFPTTQLRSLCFFFFSFRFQGEQLLAMTYDYEVKGPDDGFLDAAEKLSDLVSRASLPGSLLVNELPFCTSLPSDPSDRGSRLPRKCYQVRHIPEWLPWFSYRPLARLGHTLADELTNEPMQFVRKSMVSGELHGVWAEGLTMPCIA